MYRTHKIIDIKISFIYGAGKFCAFTFTTSVILLLDPTLEASVKYQKICFNTLMQCFQKILLFSNHLSFLLLGRGFINS